MKTSLGPKLLVYPAPVLAVGTYNPDGTPNVMTASWGGICCSQPPCVNVSLQKTRRTYANILERKAFTLSIPSAKFAREADFFGMVSGAEADKFAATGLTAGRSAVVDAPYVEEFPLVLECKLLQINELGVHTQFIGEVMDAKIDPAMLDAKGNPDAKKLDPMIFTSGTREYYGFGKLLGGAFSIGRKK